MGSPPPTASTRDGISTRCAAPCRSARTFELETRPFRPGLDEEAWLVVNNRAFDWHPEQGGWDTSTLKARESQPWFDPEGFLLHEEGSPRRLAGFCWTRVHAG